MQASRNGLRLVFASVVAATLAMGWAFGQPAFSQEKGNPEKAADKGAAKSAKEPTESKPAPAKLSKGSKRRLPRYYGKLGLSEAQREKIYGVQEKHSAEIEKLEKQLSDLREKQESECRKVLTPDQKKQLTEAVETGKSRSKPKDDDDDEMAG
jgi:hypothetical protein